MWILSSIFGIASMYGVTLYYIPEYKYSQLQSALYNSLHRLGWAIFSGWLVLGCVTSEGGAVKRFLSSQVFVPISRLTYCAYLTNGFIELYLAATIRTPKYMSVFSLVSFFFFLDISSPHASTLKVDRFIINIFFLFSFFLLLHVLLQNTDR